MWPTGCWSRRPSTAAWSWPWSTRRPTGVTVERAVTTNREIHPHLHLDGVTVVADDLLAGGDPGPGREVRDLDARAGLDRAVRPAGGGDRGRGGPDGRLPQHPRAVRPPAVHLPGDHAAGRRRRHRHRVDPGHHVAGGLATRPRAGRRAGRQRGLVVRRRGRPAGRVRHPAPPRRDGGGHLLPDPPLLPVGQADRAAARTAQRPAGPAGEAADGRAAGGTGRCRHERDDRSRRRRRTPRPLRSRRCRWATPCPSWPSP